MITEDTYKQMKVLIALYELGQTEKKIIPEQPYLLIHTVNTEKKYNPNYDRLEQKLCKCGHVYYRHFDTYEQMEACGCKYCQCYNFEEV